MDEETKKWKAELDKIIEDVQHISKNRKIFWELQRIIEANPNVNKANAVHDLTTSGYLLSCLMGLRRHVKIIKESISFMKLLSEMKDKPEVINLEFYRSLGDEDWRKGLLEATFSKFTKTGTDHIDPDIIERDMNALTDAFLKSEAYADKKIAHLDKKPPSAIPKFQELEDSWDLFESLIMKYYLVLTGTSMYSIAPIIQYDWKEIFRVPWIEARKDN